MSTFTLKNNDMYRHTEDDNIVVFLVIRFSSIGDIVLTTPVIRGIKKQVENARIIYLTKKEYSSILEHNPYIDKLITLDDNLSLTIKKLKAEHIDYIIDLHNNLRTARVKTRLRKLSFSFDKLNREKWLMVNFKKNKLPEKHIVDRYLDTVSVFDVENDGLGMDYFIPQNEDVDVSESMPALASGYIALVVGAKHFTKKIPSEKIIEFCNNIAYPVILLGGNEDAQEADEICTKTGPQVINGCGKFSLNQSASLIRQSKLVVTSDTGLMHIAAAFEKDIVSLWGNTIPEFGMYPYNPGENSKIFEVKNLNCRPCSKIGFDKCPKKHFKCMLEIDMHAIVEYCQGVIRR